MVSASVLVRLFRTLLLVVAVSTVAGCRGAEYREGDVKRAFAEQGFELRPLFDGGPLAPRGGGFVVLVTGSSEEAERYVAVLKEQEVRSSYDIRRDNVIVTAEERPDASIVRSIQAALANLDSAR